MTVSDAFETLGITPTVDPEVIRASYRRLAFDLHPDRNRGNAASVGRFKRVVRAYVVLQAELRLDRRAKNDRAYPGECPRCRRHRTLLPALDGGRVCADCLTAWGRRLLPAPPAVIASCAFAIAALVISLAQLVLFIKTGATALGYAALAASIAAVLSTAVTCVIVVEVAKPHELARRARSAA